MVCTHPVQGQNYIFQALLNRYLVYCKSAILWQDQIALFAVYISIIYNQYAVVQSIIQIATWKTLFAGSIVVEIWWQYYRIPYFFSNQMCLLHNKCTNRLGFYFCNPYFFQDTKNNFQAFFMENWQFSRQIEKSSTFQDSIQIQVVFKVCENNLI